VRGLDHLGYSERRACQAVGLDRSTYLRHKYHRPSNREIRHLLLEDAVREIHTRSRGTYGMLRIRAALEIEQGIVVNKKLVWKLMRGMGLKGLPGPKKGTKNLVNVATAEDLIQREFRATGPNELWLTDITEHPTSEGRVYCCCVLDMFSRRVVGWAIDRHCDTHLVNGALTMASTGRPASDGTVLHSDHSSQFTSWAFSEHLFRLGLVPLGEIVNYGMVAGPDPSLLPQPSGAIRAAAAAAGLAPDGFDLYEINEAFAAVGLFAIDELGLDLDRVNVNGGAIALGHPVGMSGARLALTALLELRRRGGGTAAVGLCGGGGQGDAAVLRTL